MIRNRHDVIVRRPLAEVFDFVAVHNYENHPRWEPEVLEVRPLSDGPIRVGHRAVMVRKDFGKVSETTHEVTAFDPGERIAFRHVDGPMDFEITFSFAAVPEGTHIRVDVAAQPHGAMRLMSPLFRIRMPRVGARLSNNLRCLVEAGPAGAVATLAG